MDTFLLEETPRYAPSWKRSLVRRKHIQSEGQVAHNEVKPIKVPKATKRKMDFDSDEDWTEATDLNLAFNKRQVKSRYSATSSKASHGKYSSETSESESRDEISSEDSGSEESDREINPTTTMNSSKTLGDSELENESSKKPEITVASVKKNSDGGRVYDSRNYCLYCGKGESKIGRHLLTVHKTEIEVLDILLLKKLTKERKRLIEVLREKGNFYHNLKISKTGGQIKVARRPSNAEVHSNMYSPCIYCFKYISRKELWRHKEKCAAEPEHVPHKKLQFESSLLIHPINDSVPESFKNVIIGSMRVDPVYIIVKNDKSIMRYGVFLFESQGAHKKAYICQKMRILGRLLQELRRMTGKEEPMSKFLCPECFDQCVMATKSLSNYKLGEENAPEMQTPSVALKVGYALTKVAGLERGAAARTKDKSRLEDLRSFIDLIETEWSTRISKVALNTMAENNYKKIELRPLTADLIKLRTHLKDSLNFLIPKVRDDQKVQTWRELAETTEVYATVFNRRRLSEISKITIEQFQSRVQGITGGISQIEHSLKPVEVQLGKRLDFFSSQYICPLHTSSSQ